MHCPPGIEVIVMSKKPDTKASVPVDTASFDQDALITSMRSFQRAYSARAGLLNIRPASIDYPLLDLRILSHVINNPGCMAAEICEELFIDKGLMSRHISKMCAQGVIVKAKSDEDGRVYRINITDSGRSILQAAIDASHAIFKDKFMDPLPVEKQIRLAALLTEADEIIRSIK